MGSHFQSAGIAFRIMVPLSKNKMMMNCLFLAIMLGSSSSFNMAVPVSIRRPAALYSYLKEFELAVTCAEYYGLCDVDEMWELADGEILLA